MNRKRSSNRNAEELNSDAPLEISSKSRPKPMVIFEPLRKNIRDPRFEESSGEFNKFIFKDRYGPLLKESMQAELNELQNLIKKERNPERIEQIKSLTQRLKNKLNSLETENKEKELIKKLKKEKRKEIKKSGPVYVTKATLKKAQLVEKFKEMKKSGKLTKYLEKRRKKNLSKDRKKLNRNN